MTLKSILSVAFSLACLLTVMAGTSEARGGGSRGGHSYAQKSTPSARTQRQNYVPKHSPKHKHKHKHKPSIDVDIDIDTESADTEAAEAEGEAVEAEEAEAVVYGLEITALYKGTAAREGLEIGDIILKVNGTPTTTFDALVKALAQSGGRAQILVIREDDDAQETVTLFPENGVIGVSVEPARVD